MTVQRRRSRRDFHRDSRAERIKGDSRRESGSRNSGSRFMALSDNNGLIPAPGSTSECKHPETVSTTLRKSKSKWGTKVAPMILRSEAEKGDKVCNEPGPMEIYVQKKYELGLVRSGVGASLNVAPLEQSVNPMKEPVQIEVSHQVGLEMSQSTGPKLIGSSLPVDPGEQSMGTFTLRNNPLASDQKQAEEQVLGESSHDNMQGAGSRSLPRLLEDLKKKHELKFLALLEPRQKSARVNKLARRLRFQNFDFVDARGFSGGIWCFWEKDFRFRVVLKTDQVVHGIVNEGLADEAWFTIVYGRPNFAQRRTLWESLRRIGENITSPWCIMGDFNATLRTSDRLSHAARSVGADHRFCSWVDDLGLAELQFYGPQFTWSGSGCFSRIDRAIVNHLWQERYTEAKVIHLPKYHSDHSPLLLKMAVVQNNSRGMRPFRFFAPWVTHEGFSEFVSSSWGTNLEWNQAVEDFTVKVVQWSKQTFGHIGFQKSQLSKKLHDLERQLCVTPFCERIAREKEEVWCALERLLIQEEIMWLQKSRCNWYSFGDKNTRYFHACANSRRKRNRIEAIKLQDGEWSYDKEEIMKEGTRYFEQLYREESGESPRLNFELSYPRIKESDMMMVGDKVDAEEIKKAIFAMGPLKAPGPDGLNPLFFQSQWNVVGQSVVSMVESILKDPKRIGTVNDTSIVVIPKIESPESLKDFRPISLCNVIYKVVTKVLTNRLKSIMPNIISPNQCSFVPGRQSADNIILAQEIIHSMSQKQCKKSFMAVKIDLEKAYDRLRWSFVMDCLEELRLPSWMIALIKECLSSSHMHLVWNGERACSFKPSRGIRQGDPLSPYLFVIAIERLAHLIQAEVVNGVWHPFRLKKNGTPISHLFFADDLLLFAEAGLEQAGVLKACLDDFCETSGERVNASKSRVFFSANVSHSRKQEISNFLGFTLTPDLGKYLGVPLHHKRVSKATYQGVLDKMDSRLSRWKASHLSLAARNTLVASVVSAIPSYAMQTCSLPLGMCEDIDRKCRSFLWGCTPQARKMHLVAWEDVCRRKEDGGLGLRTARKQNDAFMTKLGWGLIKRRDALWVRFLREKYKCGEDVIPRIDERRAGSQAWKGIKKNWKNTMHGLAWRIGDGSSTRFWRDRWVPQYEALQNYAVQSVPDELLDVKVSDLLTVSGGWDLSSVQELLPPNVLSAIRKVHPTVRGNVSDTPLWRWSSSGSFTLKSAYKQLNEGSLQHQPGPWRRIWKLKAPQRCKTFLWLAARERLQTYSLRKVRGLASDDKCPICLRECESVTHALLLCQSAREKWELVVPPELRTKFFNFSDAASWVRWNLNQKLDVNGVHWGVLFAIACRNLWIARNMRIFQGTSESPASFKARTWACASWAGTRMQSLQGLPVGNEIWSAPAVGYAKMNVDGAWSEATLASACGGILRDHSGWLLQGFMFHIGTGSSANAEVWAILWGLKIAWDAGFRCVELESDCAEVVDWIHEGTHVSNENEPLVGEIRRMLLYDWVANVSVCSRTVNEAADIVAKHALGCAPGLTHFSSPMEALSRVLEKDAGPFSGPSIVSLLRE
ncbi:uncharacterized protein LOC114733531 [Neltuma alba]|uniref:uncharacterized protein LOC114733531 n=1 Tax=Neltuma alba TaxID=207710 RepID=UPI0010A2CEC6|nr:uncharacterized protein LOC114733531 [Prosopis alba]